MSVFSMRILVLSLVIIIVATIYYLYSQINSASELIDGAGMPMGTDIDIHPIPPDAIDIIPNAERDALVQKKMEERSSFIKSYNKHIEYHGKIVDQFDKPVEGVSIQIDVGYWNPLRYRPSSKKTTLISDVEGKFSVQGKKGLDLEFNSLSKAGYTFQHVPARNYRVGGQSTTSHDQPDIIRAYKIDETPEKLLVGESAFSDMVPDGRKYSLDIINKKILEGKTSGQIHVAFTVGQGATYKNPTEWSVSLEANGGGLIETTDILMYSAPESGYQSNWSASFSPEGKVWTTELTRKFYLKSHNGKIYGRLEMVFKPFRGLIYGPEKSKTHVRIKYWINPEGSRNLYSTKQPY